MDAERRKVQRQHDKDMDELRRELSRKREGLSEQLEDEVSMGFSVWLSVLGIM